MRNEIVAAIGELAGLRSEAGVRAAYASYGAELYRYALRCLHDSGAAEAAVREIFLRAWRAAERYDPHRESLRAWLFAIARHVVIDMVKPGPGGDPLQTLERRWAISEGLRQLSPEHRAAIVETYLAGRPTAEVAAEWRVPIGILRSRVFYALRSLRGFLREMGVEP